MKDIKVHDKSINISKRMKDAFVRTKDKAKEAQSENHATPSEYAGDNIQGSVQGVAHDVVHHFRNPRKKASEQWSRAKGHFQEAKRQTPKERQHTAEQAQKSAQNAKTNAENLRNAADKAGETAHDTNSMVRDAKQTFKEVQQQGRQTLREVKEKTRIDQGNKPPHGRANTSPAQNRFNKGRQRDVLKKHNANNEIPLSHSGISDAGMRNITLPGQANTAPTNDIPVGKSPPMPTADIPKGGVSRPSYMNKGVQAPKSTGDGAKPLKSTAKSTGKAVESTRKKVKNTTKGTIKTVKKSIKTAEKSAKTAVKTVQRTAKTTQKIAKAAAKSAKTVERTARVATEAAIKTTKATAKAVIATIKGVIAATKGLITLLATGGWIAIMVILMLCMTGLFVSSTFSIFFSNEPRESGKTINTVIAEIDDEYKETIDEIIAENSYDVLDISGTRASWKEVLAVYAVKIATDPDNPMEVATIDDEKTELYAPYFGR